MELSNIKLKTADKWWMFIVAALVLGLGGTALYVALPYLIELAQNTIIFMVELAIAGILAIILLDKGTWAAIFYKWKNISRNIRKAIAREDPIGVLSTVIQKFQRKLESIDENINQAVAAWKRQVASIKDAKQRQDDAYAMVVAAQRAGKSEAVQGMHAAAAARWKDAIADMEPMANLLQDLKGRLEKARDICEVQIQDAENQKEVLAIKLTALKQGQKAVKSFKQFFGSNPDLEMQELAIEQIEIQASEAEAEIDQFMRVIDPMIQNADLKKQADMQVALDKFDQFTAAKALPAPSEPLSIPAPAQKELVRR
jgi:hypothetical protein